MTQLVLVRRIAARPAIIFDALITAEGMAGWYGPDAGPVLIAESDPTVGGTYRIRFRTEDGRDHEVAGAFLEVDRPRRLTMSWRWVEGGGGPGESRVAFDLRPIADGTELTLTHWLLPTADSAQGHERGWSGALDKLERYSRSVPEGILP